MNEKVKILQNVWKDKVKVDETKFDPYLEESMTEEGIRELAAKGVELFGEMYLSTRLTLSLGYEARCLTTLFVEEPESSNRYEGNHLGNFGRVDRGINDKIVVASTHEYIGSESWNSFGKSALESEVVRVSVNGQDHKNIRSAEIGTYHRNNIFETYKLTAKEK